MEENVEPKRIVEIVLAVVLIAVFFLAMWHYASRLGEIGPEEKIPPPAQGEQSPRRNPLLPPDIGQRGSDQKLVLVQLPGSTS